MSSEIDRRIDHFYENFAGIYFFCTPTISNETLRGESDYNIHIYIYVYIYQAKIMMRTDIVIQDSLQVSNFMPTNAPGKPLTWFAGEELVEQRFAASFIVCPVKHH